MKVNAQPYKVSGEPERVLLTAYVSDVDDGRGLGHVSLCMSASEARTLRDELSAWLSSRVGS
jgi:hypothetical protein